MSNHGRYIWYELMTSDVEAAKRFYGDVVGWTHEDMSAGDMTYTVLKAADAPSGVAGMMTIPAEVKAMGVPPNWTGYVCVDDCDAAAEKVRSLGGSVMRPPEDIPDIGRFAVVADPHGAVFEIMKPAPMDGGWPDTPPGALGHTSWHELYGGDPAEGFGFYEAMFGWKKGDTLDMGPMGPYQLFSNQDGVVGGMMKKPEQVRQPAWLYYFQVGDIDAAVLRVTNGGGKVVNGPMEVPGGDWIIQAVDPQGAMFALVGKRG
ncbi:VOC family protein [Phenylobacterium sp. LjRoot219]|uniref:VOC family protein n=1 Tax=Phenylobacterium sp. LjRoot219 TaxID=3342283 RepID=UPI003ECCE014